MFLSENVLFSPFILESVWRNFLFRVLADEGGGVGNVGKAPVQRCVLSTRRSFIRSLNRTHSPTEHPVAFFSVPLRHPFRRMNE